MKKWLLILLCAGGSAGAAENCEHLLRSSQPQITAENYRLSREAKRGLSRLGITHAEFNRYIKANNVFAIHDGYRGISAIVFEPNPNHADRGLFLTGRAGNGGYLIEEIELSHRDDEMDYFRAVAAAHGLNPAQIPLAQNLLNCRSLVADGWVQAKLWLKHRLNTKSVKWFIDRTSLPPAIDVKHSHKGRRPRFLVYGNDAAGNRMLAVVGGEGHCPNNLISAFELR